MGSEANPGRIILPGDRPGKRRRGQGRMSFPKKDVLFVKVHEGEPFHGVLFDLPMKDGGSVQMLMPPDQARSFAIQIMKCVMSITGETPDGSAHATP